MATSVEKEGRARVTRCGGKPDLIVDDYVDRASGAVATQLRKIEGFDNNSLPGKSGVAVDEYWDDLLAVVIATTALYPAAFAFDYRVDRLQMAGIGDKADVNNLTVGIGKVEAVSQMILDVATTAIRVCLVVVDKIGEGFDARFAQGIGKHIQTTTMGHAKDDLLYTVFGGRVYQITQGRNENLGAFERETLLSDEVGMNETFEFFCLN